MLKRINKYDLKVEENLYNFINLEVLENLGIDLEYFWKNFSGFITELTPENNKLLDKRIELKNKI